MSKDRPNSEPTEENRPTPIDPSEAAGAVKEINDAMAVLPEKRFGCLGLLVKYGAVPLVLLAAFVYWNFLRTPRLVISRETTYLTEPLTADGTRVDYFAAYEKEFYPEEIKTDANGYRLIVRELGDVLGKLGEAHGESDGEVLSARLYEKLGLDPTIKPTVKHQEPWDYLTDYAERQGVDDTQIFEWEERCSKPWTFEDLPMMEAWLEENGPALDILAEAARKPVFHIPLVRAGETGTLDRSPFDEIIRMRTFARMLVPRTNHRIATGDIDGAIDDMITCKRLGRHLRHQGLAIAALVGIAIEGIADSVGIASMREFQPTEKQLRRLVDELDAIPPRPDVEWLWPTERYCSLGYLQAMAFGDESLAEVFSGYEESIGTFDSRITPRLPVDWNIVLRRMNEYHDRLEDRHVLVLPNRQWLGNLFIGARSRYTADLLALHCMPTVQAIREAVHRSQCVDNLHRITLAMLTYEREHGTLPPAYTVDEDGTPLHGWRVLLLPYLGERELYEQLRLAERWDSDHNRQFHDADLAVYQCPSAQLEPGRTTYSVVIGEKTPFEAGEGKSLDDFGMNLILVTEQERSACWMDPTSELTHSVALKGIPPQEETVDGIGNLHLGGVSVGLRNGGLEFLSESINLPLLEGLLDGTAEEGPF